ncbi:MAG TPA: hypothetical protein VIZ17_16295 [Acetobacteraceae bacterium]
MNQFDNVVVQLLDAIKAFVDLILAGLAAIEMWARTQLVHVGVPPGITVIILILIALLLIVAALRLFGGIAQIIVVLFLLLLAVHALMPIATSP